MSDERQGEPVHFRAISQRDYAGMDQATRDRLVRARHTGIIRTNENRIIGLLLEALSNPRSMPDGTTRPPYGLNELVVVLMHREDPITPMELRASWEAQGLEVGVFLSEREPFANGIMTYTVRRCENNDCRAIAAEHVAECPECGYKNQVPGKFVTRPYRESGKALLQKSPTNTFYVAVFDTGMSSVTFLGFNPVDPSQDTVQAVPGEPSPRPVDPLPVETTPPKT